MANNKTQETYIYETAHNSYQIVMIPQEQTMRCPDTYSQTIWALDGVSRVLVWEDTFDTDEIFWSGVETQEKMLTYVTNVIDLMEDRDLGDIS